MFNFDVDSLVAKLEPAVEKVAEALGTGAEHLWTIGVTGQIAEGTVAAVIAFLGIILSIVGVKLFLHKEGEGEDKGKCQSYCGGCWNCTARYILGTILFVIAVLMVVFAAETAVMHLVAPEWMLLKEIQHMITVAQR